MGFNQLEVEKLLVQTGRRCCICYQLHHVQVHHIEEGNDDIDNAIPLCPNCHDQVHGSYVRGRVTRIYSTAELKLHRKRTINSFLQASELTAKELDVGRSVAELLRQVQDANLNLAETIARAWELARIHGKVDLETFCKNELAGYPPMTGDEWEGVAPYRIVSVFFSLSRRINSSPIWQSSSHLFENIRNAPDMKDHFKMRTMFINEPVAEIHEYSITPDSRALFYSVQMTIGDLIDDANEPDVPVIGYISPEEFRKVSRGIRKRLTEILVAI